MDDVLSQAKLSLNRQYDLLQRGNGTWEDNICLNFITGTCKNIKCGDKHDNEYLKKFDDDDVRNLRAILEHDRARDHLKKKYPSLVEQGSADLNKKKFSGANRKGRGKKWE